MKYALARYGAILCRDGKWHRTKFSRKTGAWPVYFNTKSSAEKAAERYGKGTELRIMGGR